MVAVGGDVVEGFGSSLCFLFFAVSAPDVAVVRQLLLDLGQVVFLQGDVQGGLDGFQVQDLQGGLLDLLV